MWIDEEGVQLMLTASWLGWDTSSVSKEGTELLAGEMSILNR